MIRRIQAFFNPEQYQGGHKKKNYFEGWYYKLVDAPRRHILAVIPGISMDREGKKHAFVQVLDGSRHQSEYHTFEEASFVAVPGKWRISVAENHFSADGIQLNLPGIVGSLTFEQQVPWPKPFYAPGIMGPYAFVPFMECYHGIVSMDHTLAGTLTLQGKPVSFDKGRGYTEKDWGKSFPQAYLWMQGNHFSTPGISVKASVARIPWLRDSFTGFICGIWLHNRLIRFTTYNKASLSRVAVTGKSVTLVIHQKKYEIVLKAHREAAALLAAPVQGQMEGRIGESLLARLEVRLTDRRNGEILLEDTSAPAALEVAGNIPELLV